MRQLLSYVRAAVEKYNMIESGDKIAVGVSGGKDSVALLVALASLKRFYPVPFSIVAITADPCFGGVQGDYSEIEKLCEEYDIPYIIKRTEIGRVIFDERQEKNPCSLCARMRRGLLHDLSKEQGCNKIALGHHMDDAVETFYMNLLQNGTIGCFSPVTYLSRKDITMIRPLIFAREKDCVRVVEGKLPIVKSGCPNDGQSKREDIKNLIKTLDKDYENLVLKTLRAMQRADLDGWGVEN